MTCWLIASGVPGAAGSDDPGVPTFLMAGGVLLGLIVLAVVLAVLASRAAARRRGGREEQMPEDPASNVIACTKAKEALLTSVELGFHRLLKALVSPRCEVFAKVRLADLFEVDDCCCRHQAVGMLAGKRIDFVLCDPSGSGLMAAVEMGAAAVKGPEQVDRERFIDDLFASNGLPLLRVPEGTEGDLKLLEEALARHDLLPARAANGGRVGKPAGV